MAFPYSEPLVPELTGLLAAPTPDNTLNIGSATQSYANAFLGPNHAPVLDPVSGNIGYYARTAAEIGAGVTPTNYAYSANPINVKRFGAKGDGVTDDTAAINLAFTAANYVAFNWFNPGPPLNYLKVNAGLVLFPAGDYVYNGMAGAGFSASSLGISLQGEGSNVTRIRLGTGVVLLSGTTAMFGGAKGITTYGGSGLYNLTGTGSNVEGMFQFEDINAFGYTGCYIGHCFNNAPDWFFRRMILNGAQTAGNERQSFGIVIGGLCDGNHIEDIDFQNNLVNIKFNGGAGGNGANNTLIKNCQFYRWFLSPTNLPAYDIWVVPDTSAPTVGNNGVGIKITENKFGNENVLTTDYRVIFADEAAGGTNRLNKLPNLAASTGFVGGMVIKDNMIYGSAIGPAVESRAFLYTYTPNIWQIEMDNKFNGAYMPSLDYLAAALTNKAVTNVLNRVRHLHLADVGTTATPVEPVTVNAGHFQDELAVYQGFQSVRAFYTAGFDPGYTDLTPANTVTSWSTGSASIAQITDSVGGVEAAEVTLTADGGIFQNLSTNPTQARVGFIELDLKKSSTNPLTRVRVLLQDSATGTFIVIARTINLLAYWRRIRIPFVVPGNDATINQIQVVDLGGDYSAGTNRFQVGRVRVYHAFEAAHPGTRMLDSGLVAWTPGLIGASTTVSSVIAVVGARAGDLVLWGYDNALGGVNPLPGVVTANDQVTVYLRNLTAGGITPTAGNVRVRVFKAT